MPSNVAFKLVAAADTDTVFAAGAGTRSLPDGLAVTRYEVIREGALRARPRPGHFYCPVGHVHRGNLRKSRALRDLRRLHAWRCAYGQGVRQYAVKREALDLHYPSGQGRRACESGSYLIFKACRIIYRRRTRRGWIRPRLDVLDTTRDNFRADQPYVAVVVDAVTTNLRNARIHLSTIPVRWVLNEITTGILGVDDRHVQRRAWPRRENIVSGTLIRGFTGVGVARGISTQRTGKFIVSDPNGFGTATIRVVESRCVSFRLRDRGHSCDRRNNDHQATDQ